MSLIVHINGWPGTGKLTIARCLTARLGGRLLDNHTLLNPAEALFDRESPHWWPLRNSVRAIVLEFAARVDAATPLVLTDALADIYSDRQTFEDYRPLAAKRGARLVSVILRCAPEEKLRRLASPGRAEQHKLTNAALLQSWQVKLQLLRPTGVDVLELDVTSISPEQAAAELALRI